MNLCFDIQFISNAVWNHFWVEQVESPIRKRFYFIFILFFNEISENGVERIGRVCSTSFLAAEVLCKENGAEGLCEKCETDGCNGATQYGPIAILIVLPIAIVKFLSS